MALTVTVLGCSGSYPGSGTACSGYLVRGAGTTVWLDAGPGTLANLQRHVALADLDAIVLSHEHPDHWTDLEGYRVACTYVLDREAAPVYAPAGLAERVYGGFRSSVRWRTVTDGSTARIGGLDLAFSRTDHPPETLAVRIEGEGRSLGYSADTGPGWSLEALGPGLDLALCEATYLADQQDGGHGGHLSAAQAGAMARRAGAGRLLLTHLWPTVDPARAVAEAEAAYGAPVTLATMHEQYPV
ncbi:MAG: MBL fold metallo-hydrolase [Acidimicrobiales bacterium]